LPFTTKLSLTFTASIGIAGIDPVEADGALSPSALIDRADQALYSAKHRGRNRVETWDSAMHGAQLVH
jgi:PleD family two-component response regulator